MQLMQCILEFGIWESTWQYCYVWKKCGEILNLRKEIVFRVRNVAWNAY